MNDKLWSNGVNLTWWNSEAHRWRSWADLMGWSTPNTCWKGKAHLLREWSWHQAVRLRQEYTEPANSECEAEKRPHGAVSKLHKGSSRSGRRSRPGHFYTASYNTLSSFQRGGRVSYVSVKNCCDFMTIVIVTFRPSDNNTKNKNRTRTGTKKVKTTTPQVIV